MKALTDRWRSEAGRALAEEVIARLIAGHPLDELDLDEHEGRVDLRGLPAPISRRLARFETEGWFVEQLGDLVEFHGVQLDRLDLSGAQLQSFRFFDTRITDCRFDGANCQDWRMWGSEVSDSSFAKTNLHEAVIGAWYDGRGDVWRRVTFTGADLRVSGPEGALFEDCDFTGAKLAKFTFRQCTLRRCRFAGTLQDIVFDGRELKPAIPRPALNQVDFSGAIFRDVEFMGFDLEDVTLPDDPDLRVIRHLRCVEEKGLAALEGNDSLEARQLKALLSRTRRMAVGSVADTSVFNRRDYVAMGGEPLATLAETVLTDAEALCLKESVSS